ncbi:MAG: right-handed parallel beta-helix repeat-containing protein [Oceanospirillaceae bacterium]|nr:right-handed parallel beta-helix repeat-containing protein [Oceanospirillaceae bacterium]MCP5350022.1 right-handed parallel beta-helix repeat-containing protein [Oceanospirillaceae bacterium]
MNIQLRRKPLGVITTAITMGLLSGCLDDGKSNSTAACESSNAPGARVICIGSDNVTDNLIDALNSAKTGDTLVLPAGRFAMSKEVTFDGENSLAQSEKVTGLTIKGAGMAETILDFDDATGEAVRADGFFISNTEDLTIEDLGVYEAPNNAIKMKKTDGIVIRRVATVWETDYQETNGAYGIYPVETQNVLIEDSYVRGSADAGVYVGQSENIVVRNNIAEKNVAGIEIENSKNADVYGNIARGNTGGILVFDLPIGNGIYGAGVRVFSNEITENNATNFAHVGSFAAGVHIVPPGTGVIILSTSNVEIFDNTITDHKTTSVAVTSYMLPDDQVAATPNSDVGGSVMNYGDIAPYAEEYFDGWSPLIRGVNIHDNAISVAEGVYAPTGNLIQDLIDGYAFYEQKVPDILYDGVGELLANAGAMGQIAQGINDIADGVDLVRAANELAADPQEGQRINTDLFAAYGAADGVCASNNGAGITQASVYATDPTAEGAFDGDSLPQALFQGSNSALDCGGETGRTPYVGSAATVTVAGVTYGCGVDDTTSDHCTNN